ncbi:hypothetical protein L210DRAFT_2841155 [Boletus edulis BED1]|uniref:Uncharacterized protein n=1 Tax=Boletus edulis BED1 TaxID=1328754 RepID=A0AAD4BK65_BOLED|nr:hypothetical protein L210DRAFT_2841155 [Boletus edulis BED1]
MSSRCVGLDPSDPYHLAETLQGVVAGFFLSPSAATCWRAAPFESLSGPTERGESSKAAHGRCNGGGSGLKAKRDSSWRAHEKMQGEGRGGTKCEVRMGGLYILAEIGIRAG